MTHYWRFETAAVHAGHEPTPADRSVTPAVHQSVAFAFDSAQHAIDLFDGSATGLIYSRIANPTVQALEARVATLEQGVGCVVAASGQAALTAAFLTLAGAGENLVSSTALYGTTYNLLANVLPQIGIEARFVAPHDLAGLEAAIDRGTRAVFCETIANPAIGIADLATLARLAHAHGVPLVVDNTVATPYLCRPLAHGADIVVHSLTKYMGGHGAALGGVVVDGGTFDWQAHADRYPRLTTPDASHHGVNFSERFGERAFAARCAAVPLRNLGAVLSATAAASIMQGIETLALRMERICFNAEVIARYLSEHPAVAWRSYAGSPDHRDAALAQKYLGGRGSGVLSFGIRGGAAAGARFQDALRLVRRSVNLGDCKTLACHPASTTHRQLAADALARSGVTHDLIRLSVGIEHIDDLLGDIDQALLHSQR